MKKILFILAISLGLLNSCIPDGKDTLMLSYIPVEFLGGWSCAIRCSDRNYDAFVFDFNIENAKYFKAESQGVDYNEEIRHMVFEADYNRKLDIIIAVFNMYDEQKKILLRTDKVEFSWKEYDGSYLTMINTFMLGVGCPSEVVFRFDTNNEQGLAPIN